MTEPSQAGPIGGSANERAAELRARVGAQLATSTICGEPLDRLDEALPPVVPTAVSAETDDPVDDLAVELQTGERILFQVKLRAGMRLQRGQPLAKAVKQFADAVNEGLEPGDRVVLATAEPTRPIRALKRALDRRRLHRPGSPSPAEEAALAGLRTIAAWYLDERDVETLMRHMVIWFTNPAEGEGAALLAARLDGRVVRAGQGSRAARELADAVRRLARMRGGMDALGLAEELRRREVDLAATAPPTSAVAWARALGAYRGALIRDGSTLRLFGASGSLADLPFEGADADVSVDVPGERNSLGQPLPRSLRRRGRVLLVGRPGGGKSTALRSCARHWAERADWPIPIPAHLQRLAMENGGLADTLIDVAIEDVSGVDRDALRSALHHELARGNCLLVLDGLDEVRRGRRPFVRRLERWLGSLPTSVEIVVATRPVAGADGALLGCPALEIRPPDHPEETIAAILGAALPEGATDPDSWVGDRRRWVEEAMERDASLATTPLLIVTLALIAARTEDPSELPRTRAHILRRALEDVIEGWELSERLKGGVTIGRLVDRPATEAVREAMLWLSKGTLAESPPSRDDAVSGLARGLGKLFDLRPGDASAAADDAVCFWEETGLFAFAGERLTASLRQFAELGNAMNRTAESREWIASMRGSEDLWASLALAAGLSAQVAAIWIAAATFDGSRRELHALTQAVADGVPYEDEALSRLALAMADRHLPVPEHAEETARSLIDLPLTDTTRSAIRPMLARHVEPPERRAVVDALAIVRWDAPGKADERLRAFFAAAKPPSPPYAEPRGLLGVVIDDAYYDAWQAAALRLAALSRADAEFVVDRFEDGSMEHRGELESVLCAAGHDDLAERINADVREYAERQRRFWEGIDFDGTNRTILAWAEGLASPASLTALQARRLDEIADLLATGCLQWIRPGWEQERAAAGRAWVEAVARLGGFDLAVVAAQARLVVAEMRQDDDIVHLIYDQGRVRKLSRWDRVRDPHSAFASLVECLGVLPLQASRHLMQAIASAPSAEGRIGLLERRLTQVRAWAREQTAELILLRAPDAATRAKGWMEEGDERLRAAAATWAGLQVATGKRPGELLDAGMSDPDEGVRVAALSLIPSERVTPDLRERLKRLRGEPSRSWKCPRCDAVSLRARDRPACELCSTSAPSVVEEIDRLLA